MSVNDSQKNNRDTLQVILPDFLLSTDGSCVDSEVSEKWI